MLRLLLAPVTFVAGAVTGIASVGVHQLSWPWLALAVAAPLTSSVALPAGWLRGSFALGWSSIVALAAWERPEGDYVVSAGARGYTFLVAALGLLAYAVVTLPVRPRKAADESELSGPGT